MFHRGTKLFHIGTKVFHIGTLTIYTHMVHIRTKFINLHIFNNLKYIFSHDKDKAQRIYGEASCAQNH